MVASGKVNMFSINPGVCEVPRSRTRALSLDRRHFRAHLSRRQPPVPNPSGKKALFSQRLQQKSQNAVWLRHVGANDTHRVVTGTEVALV